jgi:hypothetical protein
MADPVAMGIVDEEGYSTPLGVFLARVGVMTSGLDEKSLKANELVAAQHLVRLGLVSRKLSPRGFMSYTVTQRGLDAILSYRTGAPSKYLK